MKKVLIFMLLFCCLQMTSIRMMPSTKASDFNMHITSPAANTTITATTFNVSGSFDSVPPTNEFKLIVIVGKEERIYYFNASGLKWGPVEVKMSDFPSMSAGNSYNATLQAVTKGPTLPPFQTDPLKFVWSPAGVSYSYKITSSASSGGIIAPSGVTEAKKGESVKFTITPATGYRISDVKVDGSSVGKLSSYTFQNITSNHTIEAFFEIINFVIDGSAGSGGKIEPQGKVAIAYGSSKTFKITPDAGYKISEVLVDGKSLGSINSYTFTSITSDHSIKALFERAGTTVTVVLKIGDPNIVIDGKAKSIDEQGTKPIIRNSRTLVPIRAIVEALGGNIEWSATERKVTITLSSTTIELWISKSTAKVNGIDTTIDATNPKVVPEIINSRTMIPLRIVTENLGCTVDWDGTTKTITIRYEF